MTYIIMDEKENILAEFNLKTTAKQQLSKYKLNKHEKLRIIKK